MPRVPGDVPQVSFQPTQMPGFTAPAVQPAQNYGPQQMQQLAGSLQDVGQATSRIGAAMQRQDLAEQEERQRKQDKLNDSITNEKLIQYRVEAGQYARDFFKQEGVSARDGFQKYVEGFDEISKKYDEYFQDPIQKKLWQNKSTLYREEWRYDMANHAQEQAKIVDKSNLVGSKDLSRQDYARSVGRKMQSPSAGMLGKVASFIAPEAHKAVVVDAVKKLNSDKDEKFIQSKITEELESLHKDTIGGMLGVVQPKLIMAYLDENKGEVSPDFYATMKSELQKTDKVSNAKAEAVSIYSKLPSRDVDGVRIVDEKTVNIFLNKQREERAKKINAGEAVDEAFYDTRDSHLREMSRNDGKIYDSARADTRNAWEQFFFEMSDSRSPNYDPDLEPANAVDKLQEKFPQLYLRSKELDAIPDIVEYARRTGFGAKSDTTVLSLAKDYVEKYGESSDEKLFIAQFGNGLSISDRKRLLTDIAIAKGEADKQTIDHGQTIRQITYALDEAGLTVNGKYNSDKSNNLTEDQVATVEFQLKNEWDDLALKGFPSGVSEADAFKEWIKGKKEELQLNGGKTLKMRQADRVKVAQPQYYTAPSNKRTYNLDSVDRKYVIEATNQLSLANDKRFYFTYVDANGEEKTSQESFGNPSDRDQAMRGFSATQSGVSKIMPKENAFQPILDNEAEVLQLAVEIAINNGDDPDIGNRLNAITAYQDRYDNLKQGDKTMELKRLRQNIADKNYNPNMVVSPEMAKMLTGLSDSDFAIYGIAPSGPSQITPAALQQSNIYSDTRVTYKLVDLERAFTPAFRKAMKEKR